MGLGYSERRVALDTTVWGDVPRGLLDVAVNTDQEKTVASVWASRVDPSGEHQILAMLGLS